MYSRRNRRMSEPTTSIVPSPAQKLINTANKFGNRGLKNMQGSTLTIYDSLPLPQGLLNQNKLTFWKNVNTRQFPFTNITENKLQVGEGLVLERMYFFIIQQLIATQEITNIQSFDEFGIPALYKSDFEIRQGTNIIVKQTPLESMKPEFNKAATFTNYNVFHFDTDLTVQPRITFEMDLLVPKITVPVSPTINFFIGVTWEGQGAILNPRETY